MNAIKNSSDDSAKEVIIRTSLELFAKKGYDGVTIREIAQKTGLNLSLISYYFGGKEGLYHEILSQVAQNFESILGSKLAQVDHAKITESQFRDLIGLIFKEVLNQKLANPYLVKLIAREHIEGLPNIKKAHEEYFDRLGEAFVNLFNAGKTQGFIKKDLNTYVYFMLIGQAIDGYMIMKECKSKFIKKTLKLDNEPEREQFIQQLKLIFLDGIIQK